jgi:hypothetical protein
MRRPLLAAVFLLAVPDAWAQSQDFQVASLGTRISVSNNTRYEIDAVEGTSFRTVTARFNSHAWLGACYQAPKDVVFDMRAADGLWPLQSGKSVSFESSRGELRWNNTLRVLKQETVTVRAGTFDAWVIQFEQKSLGSDFHATVTCWYAPQAGFPVKKRGKVLAGSGNVTSWEAVRIERYDRASSAPFAPAAPGTRLVTSNVGTIEVLGAEGTSIRTRNRENELTYIAGFFAWDSRIHIVGPTAARLSALWPLEVGKKVAADVPAMGGGVFHMSVSVERTELVTTPAGTFNSFVIRWQQRDLHGGGLNQVNTYWYAPAVGFIVRKDAQNLGSDTFRVASWVMRSIQPPATSAAAAN